MLIGFIGAPCCGKSTTAFGLCYQLKQQGHAVEFFAEYARYHIMQRRTEGLIGSGGPEGQKIIHHNETQLAQFYRDNTDAISITDGCTLNCHFYGFENMDLLAETRKYDLLFYIDAKAVPSTDKDPNRMENIAQIMQMAQQWRDVIRPLIPLAGNIVEIEGYPALTHAQMLDKACAGIETVLLKKIAA